MADLNGIIEQAGSGGWVSSPANKGKTLQLLANAVFKTCLIHDIKYFQEWASNLRFKGASVAIDTGQRLPHLKADFLKDSNGVNIIMGDRSHPTSLEITYDLPDWVERMVLLFHQHLRVLEQSHEAIKEFSELLEGMSQSRRHTSVQDRSMVV